MKQYLNLLEKIKTTGIKKSDRTGTGTISLFGQQIEFNLEDGFPLVTTKKIHLKSVIHELLWFLNGDTNIKYLNDNGVRIWDEWAQTIGDYPNENKVSGWIKIKEKIEYVPYNGNYLTRGINAKIHSVDNKLRNTWVNMMKRCYDKQSISYKAYGKKGVFVDSRWHNPANFINDVKLLDGWEAKLNNWNDFELDKDYYGAGYYSKDTCVWVSSSENNLYIGNPIKIILNEQENIYHSYKDAENKTGIPKSTLIRWKNSDIVKTRKSNKQYEGIEISEVFKPGYVYRKLFTEGNLGPIYGAQWRNFNDKGVDQIQTLVDTLKNNPDDRRMIVTAWNPLVLPISGNTFSDNVSMGRAALPPCHIFFQCWVGDGRLYLKMYIRSWDYFLGGPFNIAGYALLLMMLAQVTNLEPGNLIVTAGDAHLYLNHLEQADLQLTRVPRVLPTMKLNPDVKNIFDFKYEDFELTKYLPYDRIKAQISV